MKIQKRKSRAQEFQFLKISLSRRFLPLKITGKLFETSVPQEEFSSKNIPRTFKNTKQKIMLDQCNHINTDNLNSYFAKQKEDFSKTAKSQSKSSSYNQAIEKAKKSDLIHKLIPTKMKEIISFTKFKRLNINADLIISHKSTKGEIYLGSNAYQNNVDNLNYFDVIINVIGHDPNKTFKGQSIIFDNTIESKKNNVKFVTINLRNGHSVNLYVKLNENFFDFNYLAEKIHDHFLKGNRILIHCEHGLVRSATLLAFYLRKFIFDSVSDANEFIGLKRENAGCLKMLMSSIEKLVNTN